MHESYKYSFRLMISGFLMGAVDVGLVLSANHWSGLPSLASVLLFTSLHTVSMSPLIFYRAGNK